MVKSYTQGHITSPKSQQPVQSASKEIDAMSK
jgi:hypothetical protein